MRLIALFLIFANLALWAYRDFAAPRLAGNALTQQVHPERLRLIGAVEATKPDVAAPPCLAWGPLDDGKLSLAKVLARDMHSDIVMAERRMEKGSYLELRLPNEPLRRELGMLLSDAREEACPA